MKKLLTACTIALGLFAGQAFAASPACEKSADDKKLAGAARSSHIKKCDRESGAAKASAGSPACTASADSKKLAGAARKSHIKKCTMDEKKGAAPAAAPAKK